MATNKTFKDYYNEIIAMAEENGRDDLVEFAKGRIDALNRKSANAKKKDNEELNGIKELIVNSLSADGMTVTELINSNPEFAEQNLSSQKVSSVLKKMKEEGTVENYKDKKKSVYKLV